MPTCARWQGIDAGPRLRSQWYRVDGRWMHARRAPGPAGRQGPPIVLVHGLVVSSRYMVPLGRDLARDYAVYAPDLPGFGRSARPAHVLNVPELADALAAWLAAAGLERAVLLGNSLGCRIIIDLAARYPGCVERLILAAPATDPHAPSLLTAALRLLADEPRERLAMLAVQARDLWDAGPRTALGTARYMVKDPIEAKLPLVRAPTLVVRGTRDTIVPEAWVEEAAGLLPDGRLVIMPGAPHALNFSAAPGLGRLVRQFLEDA